MAVVTTHRTYYCRTCREFVPGHTVLQLLPERPPFHNPSGLAGLGHPVVRAVLLTPVETPLPSSDLTFATEASSLGFPPGVWPEQTHYYGQAARKDHTEVKDGEVKWVDYTLLASGATVRVFND